LIEALSDDMSFVSFNLTIQTFLQHKNPMTTNHVVRNYLTNMHWDVCPGLLESSKLFRAGFKPRVSIRVIQCFLIGKQNSFVG